MTTPPSTAEPATGGGIARPADQGGLTRRRKVLDVTLVAATLVVALAGTAWFVHRYAVNSLYFDQWADVDLVGHLRTGTLTIADLWAQHTENRILFPNLIVLLLAQTTHLDVVVESAVSAAMWWATAVLLVLAHHRRAPELAWLWYSPVALLFGSTVVLYDVLSGFNLSWYMVLFALAGTFVALDRPRLTWWALATAVVIAVVGSYSSVQGLLIWPAGLILLWLGGRGRARIVAWLGAAAVTGSVYLVGFQSSPVTDTYSSLGPRGPTAMFWYFFTSLGNVFGTDFPEVRSEDYAVFAIGVLVFAVAVVAVVHGVRKPSAASALGVALIAFGLLVDATVTVSRTQLGLGNETRYGVFLVLVWLGSYFVLLRPEVLRAIGPPSSWSGGSRPAVAVAPTGPETRGWRRPGRRFESIALRVLLVLLVLQFGIGWSTGNALAQDLRNGRLRSADVAANIGSASDNLVTSYLGGYPVPFTRRMVGVARRQQLSLFATPLAAADARQGIVRSLAVRVVRPIRWSTVSGMVVLDAAVGVSGHMAGIQFVVGKAKGGQVAVIPALSTVYGYVGRWSTTTVPDGTYSISAVIDYVGGRRVTSRRVVVRVHNQLEPGSG